jgi:glycosyltransferase involved in cell wall biosynthesis
MNICHIVTSLEMGGMERVICDLLAGLRRTSTAPGAANVRNWLFCTDAEGALYSSAPVEAKACGHRRPRPWVVDGRVLWKLIRFLRQHAITCIHAHNHVAHLYAVLAGRLLRIPVVLTLHGQGFFDTPRTLRLRRRLTRRTVAVAVVSRDAAEIAARSGAVPRSKIVVIPNGVDTERFVPRRRGGELDEQEENKVTKEGKIGPLTIGTVGRFSPEKNYAMLIRAFAKLVEASRGAVEEEQATPSLSLSLILVGDGPERERLEALITALRIADHCHITGMVADVRPWLHKMDVFCLSSDTEGLSISLLEAGACGLPAVVTDVGGNREVVEDGKTGMITAPRDRKGFAAAFGRLAADKELRSAMGHAARERVVERYSVEQMVRAYIKLYEGCAR